MSGVVSAKTNLSAMSAGSYFDKLTQKLAQETQALASGSMVSNPAANPANAALGYSFSSTINSLQQASNNVNQATAMLQLGTSVLGSSNDLLTQMSQLAAQANSGTLSSSNLQLLDQTYQQLLSQIDTNANVNSRFGSSTLFGGSAGTASALGTVAAAVTGAVAAPANTVTAPVAAGVQGLVSGAVQSINVVSNGAPTANQAYTVSIVVGGQTFQGTTVKTNGGTVTLTSTTDAANSIQFNYAATSTGITNASSYQSALSQMFGLSTGVPTTFQSTSAALTGATVSVGGSVTPGIYALSYTYDAGSTTGTFKLSNGTNVWTQTLASPAASVTSGSVTFANGLSVSMTAFSGQTTAAQAQFYVSQGSSQTFNFQIGSQGSDTISATVYPATAAALGLSGSNLLSTTGAQSAAVSISSAISQISTQIASLGGVYTRLGVIGDNLSASIQNQTAAKSTFTDTNVTDMMTKLQQDKGLQQIASTVFSQALQNSQMLAKIVQSGSGS